MKIKRFLLARLPMLFLAAALVLGHPASVLADSYELSGIDQGTDLSWLQYYISYKEAVWKQQETAALSEVGISTQNVHFAEDASYRNLAEQMLCMMAVYRGYTFYNRVMCTWYLDNLWEEMHTYRIVGANAQQELNKKLSSSLGLFSVLSPAGSAVPSVLMETIQKLRPVTVTSGCRELEEMFEIDAFSSKIPLNFEGWTEEKREEVRELLAMDSETRWQVLLERQKDSLTDSPAPLYKQGAAEWGFEPFGNGTLAGDACCPAAIAMVLSAMSDTRITPSEVAARYDYDEYRDPNSGSHGRKMCAKAAEDYGLYCEAGGRDLSASEIRTALSLGGMLVMSMRPGGSGGRYANVYHYVALVGLTGSGRIIVNNPGINTDVTYDSMETILNNQSGRNYGIFFPSKILYDTYEEQVHPETEGAETEGTEQ